MTRPPTGIRSDYAPDCLRGIGHRCSSEGSDGSGLLKWAMSPLHESQVFWWFLSDAFTSVSTLFE